MEGASERGKENNIRIKKILLKMFFLVKIRGNHYGLYRENT